MTTRRTFLRAAAGLPLAAPAARAAGQGPKPDPLPAWNDGQAKRAVLDFVARVTREGKDFVPPAERVATFDNDGTLWCEQPMYVQAVFILDRLRALAKERPELKDKPAFKAVLDGDTKAVADIGQQGFADLVAGAHAGMTTEEFEQSVTGWLAAARHPRFKRPYTECVYLPMVELLAYLRASGFKTYVVSGGGIEFMRPWTPAAYGIPPEQVVGSTVRTRFELRGDTGVMVRLPEVNFVDDGPGKPVGILGHVGRRPVMAFGNSDGDLQMLQYTTTGAGPRFGLYVHHDDAEREYAYDRKSPIGRLDKGLDEAPKRGWTVVSMKKDWKKIFAFEK